MNGDLLSYDGSDQPNVSPLLWTNLLLQDLNYGWMQMSSPNRGATDTSAAWKYLGMTIHNGRNRECRGTACPYKQRTKWNGVYFFCYGSIDEEFTNPEANVPSTQSFMELTALQTGVITKESSGVETVGKVILFFASKQRIKFRKSR